MKKNIVLLIFIISYTAINAQEKRVFITGETLLDSITLSDVHIINISTKKGTITNSKGLFTIPVKLNDSLFISHLKLEDKIVTITKEILQTKKIDIFFKENTISLNEITLKKQQSIFYIDKEVTEYNGPLVSAKSLHLPYTNTANVKKDKSIVKFKTGAVINLNNLINSVNGNIKNEKQLQKIATEDTELEKIRKQFTDDFFITDLKIKKEYINQFLNNCIDKNILTLFKRNQAIKLTALLLKESKLFSYTKYSNNFSSTNTISSK